MIAWNGLLGKSPGFYEFLLVPGTGLLGPGASKGDPSFRPPTRKNAFLIRERKAMRAGGGVLNMT
jgi:hypothetical protein